MKKYFAELLKYGTFATALLLELYLLKQSINSSLFSLFFTSLQSESFNSIFILLFLGLSIVSGPIVIASAVFQKIMTSSFNNYGVKKGIGVFLTSVSALIFLIVNKQFISNNFLIGLIIGLTATIILRKIIRSKQRTSNE